MCKLCKCDFSIVGQVLVHGTPYSVVNNVEWLVSAKMDQYQHIQQLYGSKYTTVLLAFPGTGLSWSRVCLRRSVFPGRRLRNWPLSAVVKS
jgi:hypothetical protein